MANTNLKLTFYTTDVNAGQGTAKLTLSGPDQSGWYEAQVDSLSIAGQPPFAPELIKGPSFQAGDVTTIQLYTSQQNNLKILLVENPFESRVSYCGSAAYGSGIYNLTAIVG